MYADEIFRHGGIPAERFQWTNWVGSLWCADVKCSKNGFLDRIIDLSMMWLCIYICLYYGYRIKNPMDQTIFDLMINGRSAVPIWLALLQHQVTKVTMTATTITTIRIMPMTNPDLCKWSMVKIQTEVTNGLSQWSRMLSITGDVLSTIGMANGLIELTTNEAHHRWNYQTVHYCCHMARDLG